MMKGENQVVQTDPEGLKQRQMSYCWWFIVSGFFVLSILCLTHFLRPLYVCFKNQHHLDKAITELELPKKLTLPS